MTIGRVDFEQITEADLQSLIDTGVPEGIAIDYKADRYPGNDDGVREFLNTVVIREHGRRASDHRYDRG